MITNPPQTGKEARNSCAVIGHRGLGDSTGANIHVMYITIFTDHSLGGDKKKKAFLCYALVRYMQLGYLKKKGVGYTELVD